MTEAELQKRKDVAWQLRLDRGYIDNGDGTMTIPNKRGGKGTIVRPFIWVNNKAIDCRPRKEKPACLSAVQLAYQDREGQSARRGAERAP